MDIFEARFRYERAIARLRINPDDSRAEREVDVASATLAKLELGREGFELQNARNRYNKAVARLAARPSDESAEREVHLLAQYLARCERQAAQRQAHNYDDDSSEDDAERDARVSLPQDDSTPAPVLSQPLRERPPALPAYSQTTHVVERALSVMGWVLFLPMSYFALALLFGYLLGRGVPRSSIGFAGIFSFAIAGCAIFWASVRIKFRGDKRLAPGSTGMVGYLVAGTVGLITAVCLASLAGTDSAKALLSIAFFYGGAVMALVKAKSDS